MTDPTFDAALRHTAWLARERRHTRPTDPDVLMAIRGGLARWVPGIIPGWLRVELLPPTPKRVMG